AAGAALRAGALEHGLLGEGDAVRGVAGEAAGVFDPRVRRGVRRGVADGHVAGAVDGDAGHVAEDRGVGAVAEALRRVRGDGAAGDVDLVVADGRLRRGQVRGGIAGAHGVAVPQRLDAADVRVLVLHHEARIERIERVG